MCDHSLKNVRSRSAKVDDKLITRHFGTGTRGFAAAEDAVVAVCIREQIEFRTASLHVRRAKQGTPQQHPLLGDELRALRRLQHEQDPSSGFVFTSERGAPFSTAGFARIVERAGKQAKLAFKAHPHMLRHACGYALANKEHDTKALQAYFGHCNIQHTVRYTELSPTRFKDFWAD
jgi:integrase